MKKQTSIPTAWKKDEYDKTWRTTQLFDTCEKCQKSTRGYCFKHYLERQNVYHSDFDIKSFRQIHNEEMKRDRDNRAMWYAIILVIVVMFWWIIS